MKETPTITTSCYASSSPEWILTDTENDDPPTLRGYIADAVDFKAIINQQTLSEITNMPNSARRIVQVFVADPNENVPLEHSVLFKGEQKLTDLTDTELFFEVPMAEILKSHNEKRVKFLDKEATKRAGKDVVLDPVKIRELKMVVVNVAQF